MIFSAKMIYFTNEARYRIERCSYTGGSRQTVIDGSSNRIRFAALAVDEIYVYYSVLDGR